jgi:hypothetical protein
VIRISGKPAGRLLDWFPHHNSWGFNFLVLHSRKERDLDREDARFRFNWKKRDF